MLSSKVDIESVVSPLVELFGEQYPWRWEENKNVLLSEFASNKQTAIFTLLNEYFEHKWQVKNIRSLPMCLKQQLGEFSTVKNEQVIFTSSIENSKKANANIVAIWWPWGHGGTISLRLTVIEEPYQLGDIQVENTGILTWFKQLIR